MRNLLIVVLLAVMMTGVSVQASDPAAYAGVVQVDSVKAYPGDSFGVKVWLKNK